MRVVYTTPIHSFLTLTAWYLVGRCQECCCWKEYGYRSANWLHEKLGYPEVEGQSTIRTCLGWGYVVEYHCHSPRLFDLEQNGMFYGVTLKGVYQIGVGIGMHGNFLPLLWCACSGPPTRLAVSPRPIFVTILDDSARKRGKKAYQIAAGSNKPMYKNTKIP